MLLLGTILILQRRFDKNLNHAALSKEVGILNSHFIEIALYNNYILVVENRRFYLLHVSRWRIHWKRVNTPFVSYSVSERESLRCRGAFFRPSLSRTTMIILKHETSQGRFKEMICHDKHGKRTTTNTRRWLKTH